MKEDSDDINDMTKEKRLLREKEDKWDEDIWDKKLPSLANKKRENLVWNLRTYYTKEEYKKKRKEHLKRKLP